jgi:hypothetical protein
MKRPGSCDGAGRDVRPMEDVLGPNLQVIGHWRRSRGSMTTPPCLTPCGRQHPPLAAGLVTPRCILPRPREPRYGDCRKPSGAPRFSEGRRHSRPGRRVARVHVPPRTAAVRPGRTGRPSSPRARNVWTSMGGRRRGDRAGQEQYPSGARPSAGHVMTAPSTSTPRPARLPPLRPDDAGTPIFRNSGKSTEQFAGLRRLSRESLFDNSVDGQKGDRA